MENTYTIEATGGPARYLDEWDGTLRDAINYAMAEFIGTCLTHNPTGFEDESQTREYPVENIYIYTRDFDGTDPDWSWAAA